MKQITAEKAYKAYVASKNKPQRVVYINTCPECNGKGKIGKSDCPACGNEPDNPDNLQKTKGYWYRKS